MPIASTSEFVGRWQFYPFYLYVFFSKNTQKEIFFDILDRKECFLDLKSEVLKTSKKLKFSKGVSPEEVFWYVLFGKKGIPYDKNVDLLMVKTSKFSKGDSPWFFAKNWKFWNCSFWNILGVKKVFNDVYFIVNKPF